MRTGSKALLLAATLFAGPPWISIEIPGNPYDREAPDAFLLVHVFHHQHATDLDLVGRAEGVVNGQRTSVPLSFAKTSRDGVYALRRTWPREGKWVLLLTAGAKTHGTGATAVVRLGADGEVASVAVPTELRGQWTWPRAVTEADVVAALR